MSTFTHAGVSKLDGEFKVRFCNDQMRVKVLAKNGHKDIDIIELKNPMTKVEIVEYLLSIDFDNGNKEVRSALEQALDKRSVTVAADKSPAKKEAKKPKKAPAPKKVAPVVVSTKVDAALEDAPY